MKRKRKYLKFLTVALAVTLLMGLIVLPVSADDSCNGKHNFVHDRSVPNGYDCVMGSVNYQVYKCTGCGIEYSVAIRANSGDEDPGKEGGKSHNIVTEEISSGCPNNPMKYTHCTQCDAYMLYPSGGGHDWQLRDSKEATCSAAGSKTYECSYCHEVMTEVIRATSHTYGEAKTVQPTCTEQGYTYKKCSVCGHEMKYDYVAATGHRWVDDEGETGCVNGRTCSVCGLKEAAKNHVSVGWKSDSGSHWKVCYMCNVRYDFGDHTLVNGKCSVCGYMVEAQKCTHNWTIVAGSANRPGKHTTHEEKCGICGQTREVTCTPDYTGRTDCTQPLYCACGRKLNDGQKNHNFGTYICHDETHSHKCLNRGCQYGAEEPHTFSTVKGTRLCSVCKFVDKAASVAHEHTWGAWTVGANGCVEHCTDPTCGEIVTTAHVPGTADCAGNATCINCGAAVKTTASSQHGPVELRNVKAAAVGVAGYSGDTYCLTCKTVIEKGHTIEALAPDHVHSFTTLGHDATGHWMTCDCGDRDTVTAHTGGSATCSTQAVCSVCGESYGALSTSEHVGGTEITNAVPAEIGKAGYTGDTHCLGCGALLEKGSVIEALTESHKHSYTLKFDSTGHWMECECGAKEADPAAHTYVDGKCSACESPEPEKVEAHVHTYSAKFTSSSTHHWHVCTSCGAVSEIEEHLFVDDHCVTCGMTLIKYAVSEAREEAQKDLGGEKSVLNKFSDMSGDTADTYYALPIQRLYNAGIMNGDSANAFGLTNSIPRWQVMVILARIQGVKSEEPWSDKVLDKYMEYCTDEGIAVDGDADNDASREEIVYMLWVMAGRPESTQDLSGFADATSVETAYETAVRWAVEKGILLGSDGCILPDSNVTRQDTATLITRYIDAEDVIL